MEITRWLNENGSKLTLTRKEAKELAQQLLEEDDITLVGSYEELNIEIED
ncbi:hypothetical protein M0R04_08280 [Candidatus Dojkabacteria bacterium]|jgi:hypothetical protein|nr:hypothetical protein [Candidatus Dojkabacteria bacterium]